MLINKLCFNVIIFFLSLGVLSYVINDLEDVIVTRVNAKLENVHVLHQDENVTQMYVGIVGLGMVVIFYMDYYVILFQIR